MHENLQLFKSYVNLAKDIEIRHHFKDWNFIEENSFNDKKKIRINLKDTLLHYSGLYLIYLHKFDDALQIFKTLHNPKITTFKVPENKQISLSAEQLAAARVNNILLNLFMQAANSFYREEGDIFKAYNTLKDCEKYFLNHGNSYSHFISLARLAYETGKVGEAYSYTDKAERHSGQTIEILINRAFFSVIQNNPTELAKYHRKLNVIKAPDKYNFSDIVWFLEQERPKHPNLEPLFEFSVGSYYKIFIDMEEGNKYLEEFKQKYQNHLEYRELIIFTDELLAKQKLRIPSKSRPQNQNKPGFKRSKRKKK